MYDVSFCRDQRFHVELTVTWDVDRYLRLVVWMCWRLRMRDYRVVALIRFTSMKFRLSVIQYNVINPPNLAAMPQIKTYWDIKPTATINHSNHSQTSVEFLSQHNFISIQVEPSHLQAKLYKNTPKSCKQHQPCLITHCAFPPHHS